MLQPPKQNTTFLMNLHIDDVQIMVINSFNTKWKNVMKLRLDKLFMNLT